MCHPTVGDLLHGRADRVFSGVRVRRRMRAGSDVLDLYRRLPGSCARRPAGPSAGSLAESASSDDKAVILDEMNRDSDAIGQHCDSNGVGWKKPAHPSAQSHSSRGQNVMRTRFTLSVSPPARRLLARGVNRVPLQMRSSPPRPNLPTSATLPTTRSANAVAAEPAQHSTSIQSPSFRRALQMTAGGDTLPTGTYPASTHGSPTEASVIVLVTSSGNVTVRAN